MAYFSDLSKLDYFSTDLYGPVLAIGWLDKAHAYPTGKVSLEFLTKLATILSDPAGSRVNLTRGWHDNELPPGDPEIKDYYQNNVLNLLPGYPMGNGELHFAYKGIFYGAPTMIYEYIVENSYHPPAEFIEAVMQGQSITSANENLFSADPPPQYHISPEEQEEIEALLDEVDTIKEGGNLKRARRMLSGALKKWPNSQWVLLEFANTNMDLERYNEVLFAVDRYHQANSPFYLSNALQGIAYFQKKDFEQAKNIFEHILPAVQTEEGDENLVQILYYLGKIEEANKRPAQAAAYFQKIESCDPSCKEIVDSLRNKPKRNRFMLRITNHWDKLRRRTI